MVFYVIRQAFGNQKGEKGVVACAGPNNGATWRGRTLIFSPTKIFECFKNFGRSTTYEVYPESLSHYLMISFALSS